MPLPGETTRLLALLASPSAQRVLQAVSAKECRHGIAPSELEEETGLSQAQVSRLVSRLSRAGLIDGSVHAITTTPGRPPMLWRRKEGPPWDVLRQAKKASLSRPGR